MELTDEQLAFTAETDPAFKALRPDVRAEINDAETAFRVTICEMLQKLSAILPEEICYGMTSIILEVPAKFIRDMAPFFRDLSDRRNEAEALQAALAKARKASSN